MPSKICKIHAAWNEYSSVITKKETSLRNINIDDIMGSFFCPGPFYYFIFDFTKLSYTYVHPNIKALFGVDPDTFTIDDFIALVHPEDIPHFKISYSTRVRTSRGDYKTILHQAVPLVVTDEGKIGYVLGIHTDISHLEVPLDHKISIIPLKGGAFQYSVDIADPAFSTEDFSLLFSNREREVLAMVSEGRSSAEIADELHISIQTVRTHRKNILAKSRCKNATELITKCIKSGVI